jgi:hypothetical protein
MTLEDWSAVIWCSARRVRYGPTLRVYDAGSGTLRYQLPLAHASGVPQLLTVRAAYAVYTSGIELHLLRLDNGNDRIADLPRQDGEPRRS